jgi:hypothetical protein
VSSEFRDAIEAILDPYGGPDADAILAMPEMQAIKRALRSLKDDGDIDFLWFILRNNAPSVIDWVLGSES